MIRPGVVEQTGGAPFSSDPLFAELLRGLRARHKKLPAKFLYDARGSALFDRITRLPEYYLTRVERGILEQNVAQIAEVVGPRACMIEPGSGSGEKAEHVLAALEDPVAFVPVEVDSNVLHQSVARLQRRFPQLEVLPVHADFTRSWTMPGVRRRGARTFVFFPGSTIGNFAPVQASRLLSSFRRHAGVVVVGVDLRKDDGVLLPAYDDAEGVTAQFNLNMLRRLNDEYGATFDLRRFRHRVEWDGQAGRIRMFLESVCNQRVTMSGEQIAFAKGERIHTEDSWKYTRETFEDLARASDFEVARAWTDERKWFGVYFLRQKE